MLPDPRGTGMPGEGAHAASPMLPQSKAAEAAVMTQHQQPDLRALDGLRGVAAVVVMVGHILTYFVPRAAD